MMRSGADLKYTIRDLKITVLDTTPTNLLIMGDEATCQRCIQSSLGASSAPH